MALKAGLVSLRDNLKISENGPNLIANESLFGLEEVVFCSAIQSWVYSKKFAF